MNVSKLLIPRIWVQQWSDYPWSLKTKNE